MTTQAHRLDPPAKQASEHEERLIIRGGKPLHGQVRIFGAKNAVLKMMAAALLAKDVTILRNVPNLTDVHMMAEVLRHLGAKVEIGNDEVKIDATNLTEIEAPYELVSQLRASFVVLGPLLARCKEAKVSLPGGCAIGERRIDLHERGLKLLGAEVSIEHGYVYASAQKLVGTRVYLDKPSNGATENIMLAAALAEGQTIIENAAQDPEIVNLADCINAMGGKVSGAGTYQIVIDGVPVEEMHGAVVDTIPDRLEVGTFLYATMAAGGEVIIDGVAAHHIYAVIAKIHEMGAECSIYAPDSLKIKSEGRLKPIDITTVPYPGFPTDLQAPLMAVLAVAEGTSIVTETIYENRFMQVGELRRMGADIQLKANSAIVKGVPKLMGAEVKSSDLRAAASLIIAGLGAEGVTEVTGLSHLDRGYDRLEERLRSLGADIWRR
ncbi:MAG: UDP-N-acetylglucosamine 1-carboxyvinyltransferase [Candidatus Obscuribacter sp.]|jgi:UDP-N-acetylglucosamine 1-carboxyvinyltransferase|nr:UDP-N-acetylglucosamine 1-carboxyvinyltransferase [Candidatus Obscuribacter sp.]MBK9619564.1 UDP-N-acetylglucosamine 1-carboxyvinyltransferase [Candidatus Obscuribacter sp.]MBL0185089.1 UDP-N-acetylglucosamine 1-carboxyvinyltransferase [Candidatus Obscuribacter sp.]MBP6348128.1 UDP-N-acetylglucosamine 1-carboxyvinyltransferase [Candidatus Obscuribacter sp.]MBP6591533.1 UDP-N-acetylglucosamine 1-carboxyvinyltransferase [Candidatus Obscuribacter sp.]